MKKVKSTTKKELSDFDLDKIKRFTQQEINNLSNSKRELPFCFQIGSDILVGDKTVKKIDDSIWQVTFNQHIIKEFYTRKYAIFYAIALYKNDQQLAGQISDADATINRLEFDAIIYRSRYKSALEKNDDLKADVYSSRYLITMDRLELVKKELQNSLKLAKYIKV